MAEMDLMSPEHPTFPHNAEELRSPERAASDHEKFIRDVFLRFQNLPDFERLPLPTQAEKDIGLDKLRKLEAQLPDPVADQDDRVLSLAIIISDHPTVFGKMGYYLAAQIMGNSKSIENTEFRRAFLKEYVPALPGVREYLRRLAGLRRRGRAALTRVSGVPEGSWGSPERRAAVREQMELVQNMPDHHFMEKYWRMLEIIRAYPDFFGQEQWDKLSKNTGIEKTWHAHLAKARHDLNYYHNVLLTAKMMREVIDSAIKVLREIAQNTKTANAPEQGLENGRRDAPDEPASGTA